MAVQLIQKWKLAALHVALDLTGSVPEVRTRLAASIGLRELEFWQRRDPLADFGLEISGDAPTRMRIPLALSRAVEKTMETDLYGESALWLRLEPPYGYLGAAPWEQLGERIRIPVVRVPGQLPTSSRLGKTLRIALLVTQPPRARWGAKHVRDLATALDSTISGVEIEVFPDAGVAAQLRDAAPLPASVTVHDPADTPLIAQDFVQGPRSVAGLRSVQSGDDPRLLWMQWLSRRLGDRAVSAVHVAGVGVVDPDLSMLAIAPHPAGYPHHSPGLVDADDLWYMADLIGASTLSIAAPESRGVDVGARMVADRLGQLRPGPTIFSSMRRDPEATALAAIHAFLASRDGRELPSDSSWFGYLQPEAILDALDAPVDLSAPVSEGDDDAPLRGILDPSLTPPQVGAVAGEVARTVGGEAAPAPGAVIGEAAAPPPMTSQPWADSFDDESDVPRWVASASRFIETRQANMLSNASLGEESLLAEADHRGSSDALADIQALVHKNLGGTTWG